MREPEATITKQGFRGTAKSLRLHSLRASVQWFCRLVNEVARPFRVPAPSNWYSMKG
jgi:hypothetical protein